MWFHIGIPGDTLLNNDLPQCTIIAQVWESLQQQFRKFCATCTFEASRSHTRQIFQNEPKSSSTFPFIYTRNTKKSSLDTKKFLEILLFLKKPPYYFCAILVSTISFFHLSSSALAWFQCNNERHKLLKIRAKCQVNCPSCFWLSEPSRLHVRVQLRVQMCKNV